MKKVNQIIATGLMALMLTTLSFAQSFDTNRMNRDIRIMENILGEMFKTQFTSKEGTVEVRSNSYVFFSGRSAGSTKGTYIPGYGVIFMIPSTSSRYSIVSRGNSEKQVVFEYSSGDGDSDRSIDEESVTTRISEFLQDYASTIGQLKSNENIMVIYGAGNSNSGSISIYNLRGAVVEALGDDQDQDRPKPLPVISVSAKKSDLEAYRAGRLNADAFQEKLSISTSEEKERLDLKVLGNIFQTALGEGDGDQFHLINSNSLSYLYLENFGALYSLDIHRGHGLGGRLGFGSLAINTSEDRQSLKVLEDKLEERETKIAETLETEYNALLSKTKEFIVDYGRTLSSLKNNQYLMVSLTISDSNDNIPERVDFQVKKSTFTQLDKGQISREAALNAVTLTEY
jgi:hypothetical protein